MTTGNNTLYFGSEGLAGWEIYAASRMSTFDPFISPQPVSPVNSGNSDFNPYVLPDGNVMYLTSNRLVGFSAKIFRSEVQGGAFIEPVMVEGLSGGASVTDTKAVVTPDELTIYFASDRPDDNAAGLNDIWKATRSSKADPFESVNIVEELNSPVLDEPSWISADGCTLYFQSARTNLRRVYVARKP